MRGFDRLLVGLVIGMALTAVVSEARAETQQQGDATKGDVVIVSRDDLPNNAIAAVVVFLAQHPD